ncbi:MAG: glycoside hydrolase family 127 protein [Lachnospiraceae bacterium]|nr:glycoside hydrolase family 127 protein [Lachnospiraceae bacterium]
MLERIPSERVRLLPGLFRDRMEINRRYLLSLDERALLQNYALEAGERLDGMQDLADPASSWLHWGWESPTCQLRGHFLGHWMSAAAALVRSEKDRVLKARLFDMIDRLREYQLKNGGRWVGPIPEKYFDLLLAGGDIWSPQYVMHKLFMGLLDAYECTAYSPALTILSHLSDWYVDFFARADAVDPAVAYRGESGGMLEIWTRLYRLTGEEKYRSLLKRYEYPEMFRILKEGGDPLSGEHANTSIPWILGAARLYEIKHKEEWISLVKAFWDCAVSRRGSYCTGGANAGEFWVPAGRFGEYAGERNQEFCTVYNMVRLADYLFRFTGETVYADYIERNLYNGFLAQQNAKNGMPAYFLPMAAGSRKSWGSEKNDFWCCHGSMVQAHAIVSNLIYYRDEDKVTIAQYIPSRAEFKIGGAPVVIEIRQNVPGGAENTLRETEADERSRWSFVITVRSGKSQRFLLRLRIPSWVKGQPFVSIGGERRFLTEDVLRDGYLKLDKEWEDEEIRICFPAELRAEEFPDRPDKKAVMEGPIVLAALAENVCLENVPKRCLMKQSEHVYVGGPWLQSHYRLPHDDREIVFKPLYEVDDEIYTLYCNSR